MSSDSHGNGHGVERPTRNDRYTVSAELFAKALKAGLGADASKLLPQILQYQKSANFLNRRERELVKGYLSESGLDGYPESDIETVQFSREEAKGRFGLGYDASVSRALEELERLGILKRIAKGVKGHSSVYLVCPFPSLERWHWLDGE